MSEQRAEYYAGVKPEEMSDIQAFLEMIGSPCDLKTLVEMTRVVLSRGSGRVTMVIRGKRIVGVETALWDSFD